MIEREKLLGLNSEAFLLGYEQLRRDVLGISEAGAMKGKGLMLFLRHGMLAWLNAWSECKGAVNETENEREEAKVYMIPGDMKYQAALLLANMALQSREKVPTP